MAKKDKSKGKGKVPKTVAGLKVPKALRKGLAGSLLDNPRAREILADVLMAAAGAAAATLVKHRPTGREVANAGEAVLDAGTGAAGAITEAVTEAARHILPGSRTSGDDEPGADKTESYAHLAGQDRKGKKDKQRTKASKH